MTPAPMKAVVIAAGGTGGHVFPALAVADVLRERGVDVVWLGTHEGIEGRVVPEAGYRMEWIAPAKIRGQGVAGLFRVPLSLGRALWQAWRAFSKHHPGAVLGMGGYVAGPAGFVALLRRVPLIIHEQNSVAGLTNRLLYRFAARVYTAFPGVFDDVGQSGQRGSPPADDVSVRSAQAKPVGRVMQIGNPVRQAFDQPATPVSTGATSARCRLLVIGGSQGARILNETVPEALQHCEVSFEVRHQCGHLDLEPCQQRYAEARINATVTPFIDNMVEALRWADLVLARAGAMTVAEIAASGVASVLVPYPYATDDHQTTNARWLVEQGAAVMIPQSALDSRQLADELDRLGADAPRRTDMAARASALHQPAAASTIAEALMEVSH